MRLELDRYNIAKREQQVILLSNSRWPGNLFSTGSHHESRARAGLEVLANDLRHRERRKRERKQTKGTSVTVFTAI